MKPVFSTLLAASLTLLTPQLAEACFGNSPFTRQDIAFSDVIFEGHVTGIVARPRYIELTFDVHDVVRGELKEDVTVIGWRSQYYDGTKTLTVEEFITSFGETTRVAISTPQLADKFCNFEMRSGNFRDEETGELITGEALQPVCDSTAHSLVSVARENIPFVLKNGQTCGSTYLYSVERYNKMRDYDKNLADFELAIEGGLVSSRELFLERVGHQGGLPWKDHNTRPENIVGRLFREHTGFFTPSLRTNAAWQASLMDLGEEMLRKQSEDYNTKFENDEASLLKFRESLKTEIFQLMDYIEKDPEFRNRLLQDD